MPKTKAAAATTNIHAVVGSDESEIKRAAAELATKLTPADAGDFGLEIIDGAADNADQAASRIRSAIEALQTIPFFGTGKLVWLKNANFLGDNILGRSASVQEALEELAAVLATDLGPEVKFLLSAPDVDKRRSFYKTLSKHAETQVIDRLDASRTGWEEAASDLVQRSARQRRLQFDEEALELFVLLTGGDTRQITNELEKIDLYLGRSTGFQSVGKAGVSPASAAARMAAVPTAETAVPRITVEQVRALVPLSRAGVIFELGNALAAGDLDRALKLVRELLDQGESAIGILLVAIVPTIRNLLLAKDLMQRHRLARPAAPFSFISALNRLPESASDHLPRKKDGNINGYALGIAAQHAHRFEIPQLIAGLEACLQGNVQLVTSQLDHELILTEIVVKLLGLENVGGTSVSRPSRH
ncbi:MAG: DNA polymerase III subunit delta [Verrucomicrobiota bacterium]